MTFNENKYGILSNLEHAWFLQRVETANGKGKTLQYYGPIDIHSTRSPSMLKAFVGIILLAEVTSTSTSNPPPGRYFSISHTGAQNHDRAIQQAHNYHSTVVAGSYPVLELDPCLCHFDRSSVRHTPKRGCTLKATLARGNMAGGNVVTFCKIVDLFQRGEYLDALDTEVSNYALLQNLQGAVIPQVKGYYNVWGLLRLLALDDVGTVIPEDGPISDKTRRRMKSALSRIHSAGYVHGDIARRNFCKKGSSVFLVDLETLARGSHEEMSAELAIIDTL